MRPMRPVILILATVATLGLAACDKSEPYEPTNNTVVVHEDECPRPDGEPCR